MINKCHVYKCYECDSDQNKCLKNKNICHKEICNCIK